MIRRTRKLSSDVTERWCENSGSRTPCVNVKVRPLYRRLPPDVRDNDPDNEIYNLTAEEWWESVPDDLIGHVLRPAFPGCRPAAHADGRSNGWLCVSGIGVPEDWTSKQLEAWEEFAHMVRESIEEHEQVYADNVRANLPVAYLLAEPHGSCGRAGRCLEHAQDRNVKRCR